MALKGKTNEEKIWNYLLEKLGNEYGVAGLIGNIQCESQCNPKAVEYLLIQRMDEDKNKYKNVSFLKGWKRPADNKSNAKYNNDRYTNLVDKGTITKEEFIYPRSYTGFIYQYGYGLTQLTSRDRKEGLYDLAKSKNKSISNLSIQLQYLIKELKTTYSTVYKTLKNAKSVKEASNIVLLKFECPSDCSDKVKQYRANVGLEFYNKYAKKKPASSSNSNNNKNQITIIESAIQWMENTAKDNSHGYDQTYRWNEKGDYDCSSAVFTAWEQAGVKIKTYSFNKYGCAYTGSMKQTCLNNGFKDVTSKVNLYTGVGLVRGDILLNIRNHVAMYCGNGLEVEASINEYGTANGGKPGDQTGKEFLIKSYRNYPWDCVLRYGDYTATTTAPSNNTQSNAQQSRPVSNGSHTVIADELNVRTWAGTTYPTTSFSPLKYGDKVDVVYTIDAADGTGGKWSLIKWNGLAGFVSSEWIE